MKLALLVFIFAAAPLFAAPLRPTCDAIESFTADPPAAVSSEQFRDFAVDRAELCDILVKYHEVTENQWLHTYHHVAFADRTGTVTLKDGVVLNWLVRPGGLAKLSYPNGMVLFLAREKHRSVQNTQ